MKTMRNLFLLCAGLSLFACSSDDDATQQFPEGTGKVVVKIVSPTVTRALTSPTSGQDGNELKVTGNYSVTLTAASIKIDGETQTSHTISIDGNSTQEATFNNVISPSKVVVTLNQGAANYNSAITTTIGDAAATSVPVYGETATFTPNSSTGTVVYEAEVKMAIPVARLEIGNITFNSQSTNFTSLPIAGIYLDNLRTDGGSYSADNDGAKFTSVESTANYYFQVGTTLYGKSDENEAKYILGNEVTGNFLGQSAIAKLPTTEQVYAYNFYGATPGTTYTENYACNPQIKICFSEAQLSTEGAGIPRYAMITKYKKDDEYITLENGKIYRVTSVSALSDQNIQDDEDGEVVEYTVEVTVEEASWTIVDVTGEWK